MWGKQRKLQHDSAELLGNELLVRVGNELRFYGERMRNDGQLLARVRGSGALYGGVRQVLQC
jgi:hypothetical protein